MSDKNYIVELVNGENYVYKGVHYERDVPTPADEETALYLGDRYFHVSVPGQGRMEVQHFFVEKMTDQDEAMQIVQDWKDEQEQEIKQQENAQVISTVKAESRRYLKNTSNSEQDRQQPAMIRRAESNRNKPRTNPERVPDSSIPNPDAHGNPEGQ